MTKTIDDADRKRDGALPSNPAEGAVPMDENGDTFAPSEWDALWKPLDSETFSAPPPKRSWLLNKVLPLGKVGMLAAEGGAGKTMALCQLALAVATGRPWLGNLAVAQAAVGRVLLVLGEEDAEEVRRRMWNASRAMGLGTGETASAAKRIVALPLAGVPCSFLERETKGGELADSRFAKWLRSKLAEPGDPWRLIVLDPLSRFAGADAETDNAAATRFIQSVEALATSTGATALVAHHTNKLARGTGTTTNTSGARGSSALTDGARWVATLSTEELAHDDVVVADRLRRVVTFKVTKSNYAKPAAEIMLRHDNENGGALLPCDEADTRLVNEARGRMKGGEKDARGTTAKAKTAGSNDVEEKPYPT